MEDGVKTPSGGGATITEQLSQEEPLRNNPSVAVTVGWSE